MRATFVILCEGVGTTDGGSPILFGIFRSVRAPAFPNVLPPMVVAVELECDEEYGLHDVVMRFIDEDGRALAEHPLQVQFFPREDRGPSYAYFTQFVPQIVTAERPGWYRLDLEWRGLVIGGTTFDVR